MHRFSISQSEAYRICILMDRDVMLMQLLEDCSEKEIDVITPFDEGYPTRLLNHLGLYGAPPLFFCGDIGMLQSPCAGIIGTSGIKTPDMFKQNISTLIPALGFNGFSLVTSGDAGACFHARKTALEENVPLITVMNGGMADFVSEPGRYENTVKCNELIISAINPFTGFNPDMQASVNRLIYCQSLSAFVSTLPAKSTEVEVLRKKYCPYLYAFDTPENAGLINRGFTPIDDITFEWVSSKALTWFESENEQLSFL